LDDPGVSSNSGVPGSSAASLDPGGGERRRFRNPAGVAGRAGYFRTHIRRRARVSPWAGMVDGVILPLKSREHFLISR